ncbi:chemosensory receptor A [Elysia marginata]|uniref:Chemosensory receptor A n=1 Tax=Elysia marginata TaxID=1093978 RepID=A0AAV4GHT3_9GAST|nr:chemosensory receptor A [Elysia marginata]
MSNDTDSSQGILPFTSYYIYTIFAHVNGLFLILGFGLFGVLSNTANIIVYAKMGFSDTVNISLLALSACDLIVSLSSLVVMFSSNPLFVNFRLPSGVDLEEVAFVAGTVFMYPCLGLGACVTAILSTERCLSVVLPLKVSTKRSIRLNKKASNVFIFAL